MSGWLTHIVVAIDGSAHASHAARFAGELARASGATLSLLHIAHLPAAQAMAVRPEERVELDRRLREGAAGLFGAAKEALAAVPGSLDVREIVEIGEPAAEIVAFAARNEADLVVIGSRGLTPLEEILLGSVSERVARHAPCPVTVVR